MFAQWAIVFFGQFSWKITEVAHIFMPLLLSVHDVLILQKWIGIHFGRFFQKLIWSPWP
jgi:hypothetical protein